MKHGDLKRDIVSKNRRESGSPPKIGQVTRLRHSEVSSGERRRRRRGGDVDPNRKRKILLWSGLIGLGATAVICMAVMIWILPRLHKQRAGAGELAGAHEAKVRVVSKFPSPSQEEALASVRRAIENRDPQLLGEYFREGGTPAGKILDFLVDREQVDGPVERYDWMSSMDMDGLLLEGVLVVYKGREKPVERIAYLTPDASGKWKLDFDAFARTVSPSWKDLLENGAEQGVVRAIVASDVYYNGPFSDESQWVCYGIASPDIDEILRGYCRVGSKQEEAMKSMFADGSKSHRATFEIRRVKGGESRQFEITRVLAGDWVLPGVTDTDS